MSFICHKVLVLRASFLDTYLWKCLKPVFNSRFLSNDLYLGCKSSSSLPRTTTALCLCVHLIGVCEPEDTTAPRQEIVWKITQQSSLTSLKKQLSSPHCEGRDLLISYPSLSKRKLLSSGGPACVRLGPRRSEDSLLEPALPGLETKCHLSSKLSYFKLLFAFMVLISFPLINGYV